MDGALRPNTVLEDAPRLAAIERPDSLAVSGGRLLLSSGSRLFELGADGQTSLFASYPADICAVASSETGNLAIGLQDGSLVFTDQGGGQIKVVGPQSGLRCITALLFESDDSLLICNGSARYTGQEWKRDLMEGQSTGSVWRCAVAGGTLSKIADRLAFPFGLTRAADGGVIVSESWRHRLVRIDGNRAAVLADLPGYPARIVAASDGGYWLSIFAPRSQLIEFVLQQKSYRTEMMATIDPDLWIAPSMHAARSFREPLQGGALKHLGILKPWAPSRSYGMVAKLDASFEPTTSLHSRADGLFHGVTSCIELGGKLYFVSRSAEEVRSVSLEELENQVHG